MQKDVSVSELISTDMFLPRILRQGRHYSTVVAWLLRRAFAGRTAQLAIAVVLSLLHLGSQAAAIFVVYWYGKQMEQSGRLTVPFLNIEINLNTGPQWLWAIVAVATFCFIVSAALLYLSRKQILDMVEGYFARSLEQLVLLSLRVPEPRAPLASYIFRVHGLGGLTMGCRRGSITAITFASAITAVVGGLGAAFFLFRIDLSLTLVIVGSALLAAVFLYPLTLRAVKSARDVEKAQAGLRAETRKLNEDPTVEQTATSLETADEVARSFMMRRRVLTEFVFATEIGITILLGIVIYYMASQALAGKEQWAIFIAYIAALRMTLHGAALGVRAFASVSRYYPQIVRYHLFMKEMETLDATRLGEVRRGDTIVLGMLSNGKEAIVQAGESHAMLSIGPIHDATFALVGAKLEKSGEPVGAMIVAPDTVRQGPAGILLVSAQRPEQDRDKIRAMLASEAVRNKLALIVYTALEEVGTFGERRVLTSEDGELLQFVAIGTEEGAAALKECAQKAGKRKKAGRAGEEEEEDDV
jgi:ABC-type multidrug transport system fused ATPase/permease subunit